MHTILSFSAPLSAAGWKKARCGNAPGDKVRSSGSHPGHGPAPSAASDLDFAWRDRRIGCGGPGTTLFSCPPAHAILGTAPSQDADKQGGIVGPGLIGNRVVRITCARQTLCLACPANHHQPRIRPCMTAQVSGQPQHPLWRRGCRAFYFVLMAIGMGNIGMGKT